LFGLILPLFPQAVALIGSLIMPHNIYLHSALVQSRKEFSEGSAAAKKVAIKYFSIEAGLSLTVCTPSEASVLISLLEVSMYT
jgi:Mn2+/Fe2+ NRAMP family transporter